MPLKVRTETVGYIDYDDLNDYVRRVYPFLKNYHFVAVQECGNDTDHRFEAGGWDPNLDEAEWAEARRNGFIYTNSLLLDRLAYDGHISPGTYVVRVSW